MAFKPTPEMEEALRKVLEQFNPESDDYDEDNFLDRLTDYENDYMPDDIRNSYTGNVPTQDMLDWEKFVYKDTPWKDEFNGEAHDPDNQVTAEAVIDKDDDGDADVTVVEQDDGKDVSDKDESSDKPHDEGLACEKTLEEDLMLKPDMPPEEFSKLAAEKHGAKKGEAAPDMKDDRALNNVLSDSTQKNIIRTLSAHRW